MESGQLPQAQIKRAAPLLAALLLLLAAWFGWSGVTQWRADARETGLTQARDQVASAAAEVVGAQARTLQQRLDAAEVQTALAAGDGAAAATALLAGWPGAEHAQFLRVDLAAAYAEAAQFGYGGAR